MITVTTAGRTLFALGLIGLGIEHFIFGQFVTARAPAWPEAVPGGAMWAYVTGAGFIVASAAIVAGGRHARTAALLAGTLIFVWALLRNIPVVAADAFLGGLWTNGGKSLVFFAGSFAVAGTLPELGGERGGRDGRASRLLRFANRRRAFLALGRVSLGLFMVMTGIQHFLHTPFVASLIPDWFPGDAVLWTYFAGVALIAGGVGLNVPKTARLAALLSGAMVFSWFWIVHLPRTFVAPTDGLAVFEALSVSGIAFVLANAGYGRSRWGGPGARRSEVGASLRQSKHGLAGGVEEAE